jgi:amino acid transporter
MSSSHDPLDKARADSSSDAGPTREERAAAARHIVDGVPAAHESTVDEFGLDSTPEIDKTQTLSSRVKTILVGKPRDLADHSIFHSLSLVAFLAWVGLGADGLSSSCYGPAEAFAMLTEDGKDFRFLAIFLALATALTVFVISACYSHILEEFPSGGGGYLVASKLLGPRVGVVSGCALLVDYALTITTSIAAAGDALFGLLPPEFHLGNFSHVQCKMAFECTSLLLLILLNLRGIKESVTFLLPIFLVFLIMHAILIVGALTVNAGKLGEVGDTVVDGLKNGAADPKIGAFAMLAIFLHAYCMGAGTYTGIEAVSNSMPVMREPRVATAKRTMLYMALSLALTAGGLMIAYLLLKIEINKDETMNTVLAKMFVGELGLPSWAGQAFVLVTVISEGCLLLVAAQAGFIDGPRVLANMARDSWMPHWFGNLSERLSVHNGILVMGLAGLAALWFSGGVVTTLVVMYSINVFVTFSLSMIGMCRHWYEVRAEFPIWKRRFALFLFGGLMCLGILAANVYEKFWVGGWVTIAVTGVLVGVALLIHRYYDTVVEKLTRLNSLLSIVTPPGAPVAGEPDHAQPTAAVLVGGYSGLGVHTMLNALRFGPGKFSNMVFLSVGIVDSGNFKGADAVDDLRKHTEESLDRYVDHARRLGMPAVGFMSIGTDPVEELERLCVEVQRRFPRAIFFAGRLVFQRDTWYQRLLHNETAYSLQRRLQWDGVPMVILPTRVR